MRIRSEDTSGIQIKRAPHASDEMRELFVFLRKQHLSFKVSSCAEKNKTSAVPGKKTKETVLVCYRIIEISQTFLNL